MQMTRRSEPTKLDHAPKGTLCTVNLYEEGICVIYIQTSKDESDPIWEIFDDGSRRKKTK